MADAPVAPPVREGAHPDDEADRAGPGSAVVPWLPPTLRPSAGARPYGSWVLGPADEGGGKLRMRVRLLLTVVVIAVNLIGALSVTILILVVIPGPGILLDAPRRLVVFLGVPLYTLAAVVVGTGWGAHRFSPSLDWVAEERPPDREEQRAALRAPFQILRAQAAVWLGGMAVFTTLAGVDDPELIARVALTILFGGAVTCTYGYLLSELVLRPVAARALAADIPPDLLIPGITARALLAWAAGSAVPIVGFVATGIFALVEQDVSPNQLAVTMVVVGGAAVLVGLQLTLLAVRATADPIRGVRRALDHVERGEFETRVPVYDGTEVGQLQAGFNRMATGLGERERMRDLFGRHVGEVVATTALAQDATDGGVGLGGEVRQVAVVFVDVIGSTALAAARHPTEVVDLLNRFFSVVVDVVEANGGFVNKFQGDSALAVFGAPTDLADAPGRALAAARGLAARLRTDVPELEAATGVAVGPALAGNVGDPRRFEYTVIGDPVNAAARLTELAKGAPTHVLAAMEAVEQAGPDEACHWAPGDEVVLRGRPEATRLAHPIDPTLPC